MSSCLHVVIFFLSSFIFIVLSKRMIMDKSLPELKLKHRNVYIFLVFTDGLSNCRYDADIIVNIQIWCRYVSHNQMIFFRSTTQTEEFSTFLLSSNWSNKNCRRWTFFSSPNSLFTHLIKNYLRWNLFLQNHFLPLIKVSKLMEQKLSEVKSLSLPRSHFLALIKVSTFQGWRRGAVQRCFPSFQQGRWRYFQSYIRSWIKMYFQVGWEQYILFQMTQGHLWQLQLVLRGYIQSWMENVFPSWMGIVLDCKCILTLQQMGGCSASSWL